MTDDTSHRSGPLEDLADDMDTGLRRELSNTELAEHGYYYNTTTGAIEHGPQSMWSDRIGPYPTREEAEQALETAQARNEAWDEEDRRWREED